MRSRSASREAARLARYGADTRTCEGCGTTFTRRDKEAPRRWAARLYCSRTCANRATRAQLAKGWTIEDRGFSSPCWIWEGATYPSGYGKVNDTTAHRVVYEAVRGPIPDDLHLDHLCEVRRCVNPDHLEPVTPGENVARSWRRGRRGPTKSLGNVEQ